MKDLVDKLEAVAAVVEECGEAFPGVLGVPVCLIKKIDTLRIVVGIKEGE